jgi:hypothetical protein
MKMFVVILLAATVTVTAASIPLPRKVVLNADNLEILRLDIMGMEVRLSNNMKEQADRVVAALDRHGAKLDESGADLRRANIAMSAALDRQAARMDVMEDVLNRLINATLFQIDVRPLIHGFETVVKSARLDARAAADAAREAVLAANVTRDEVKEAVVVAKNTQEEVKKAAAAAPSTKAAPGWNEWQYWWDWWRATWYTPMSLFFLGFSLYQAENKAHKVMFFGLGIFFHPYLAGVTLLLAGLKHSTTCCRRTKPWIQLTPCGKYFCPRAAADVQREEVLAGMAMGRTPSRRARARAGVVNSTMYESALDETPPPVGFWAYARSWLNPFSQYRPLGARNSFFVWYV